MAVQQLGDFRVCELLTVALAKPLAVFVGKTVREFQQALGEITLTGEVRRGVCPVELRIQFVYFVIVLIDGLIFFEKLVGDLQQDKVFPEGGDKMLAGTLAQVLKDILFELDKLVSLRLEVYHDVSFIGARLVAGANEEGGLAGALTANDEVDLTANCALELVSIEVILLVL